jgi:WD40 repeat protein
VVPGRTEHENWKFFWAGSLRGGTLLVWDANGERIHTRNSHEQPVWYLFFSPDGERLASTSFDGMQQTRDNAGSERETTP